MSNRRRFPEGPRVFIFRNELGLWWASSEAIGCRGQFLGTASCTECREQGKSICGGSVWMQMGQVQRVSGRNCAWRCFYGAPEGWAGVASRQRHRAVPTCVKSGAVRGRGARERRVRSGCAGLPGGVALAWLGVSARSVSRVSAAGNWSVGS
jgi:hypothetical protein